MWCPDRWQTNALLEACEQGTWHHVLHVLNSGNSFPWTDPEGFTALHYACIGNNLQVATKLLQGPPNPYRMNVNSRSNTEETPLHIACQWGHLPLVELFLACGADVVAQDDTGDSPLHVASVYGHDPVVQKLLICQGMDINAENHHGHSPFFYACFLHQSAVVKTLLDHGANVNQKSHSGLRPLHCAVRFCSLHSLDTILEKDPDVDVMDGEDQTPLHYACYIGSEEVARRLLDHGADVNLRDANGYTPHQLAAFFGKSSLVRLLLRSGASGVPDGDTDLGEASEEIHCQILRVLFHPPFHLTSASRYIEGVRDKTKHGGVIRTFLDHLSHRLTPRGVFGVLLSHLASQTCRVVSRLIQAARTGSQAAWSSAMNVRFGLQLNLTCED